MSDERDGSMEPDERTGRQPSIALNQLDAHALRGPLHRLINSLGMLADERHFGSLNDDQRLLVGLARVASRQLECLIEDVITLTRAYTGGLRLDTRPASLADLLRAAVTQAQPRAANTETDAVTWPVILEAVPDTPPLICDAGLLLRALRALIENAIRFSAEDTPVTITVTRTRSRVEITVTGGEASALPADDAERIFEPLESLSPAKRQSGLGLGIGLGLPLARAIVTAHGGSLVLRPRRPRDTSGVISFVCTLPPAPPARSVTTPAIMPGAR